MQIKRAQIKRALIKKRKAFVIALLIVAGFGATVFASTQISLDSPATLPSDI
jgi:hypothetical protein